MDTPHIPILVTGGAGYIGSHVCKALKAAGFTPVAYDNLSNGHEWSVKFGPLVKGELTNTALLHETMQSYAIKGVIHLAALASVSESVSHPELYFKNNVEGSQSLIEAMKRSGIENIVFSGSCAVYGIPAAVPIPESEPLKPISPYGDTKRLTEQALVESGLRYASLRYFNAAGADPEGELGEDHSPETHLIPLVLDVALGRRPHITIYGDDYPTPDGSCIRDYIHVSDLAEAHVLALKKLLSGHPGFITNLGTGTGISVRELITAAREVTGHPIPAITGPRRDGDPPALISDVTHCRTLLDWQPQRSSLMPLLTDAWNWHRRHFA